MPVKLLVPILLVVTIGIAFLFFSNSSERTKTPEMTKTAIEDRVTSKTQETGIVAKNLQIPWSLAFLPDGDLVFTQRTGEVMLLAKGTSIPVLVSKIDDVLQSGEGGLLGIAVSPNFPTNKSIFVYFTYLENGSRTLNRVVRYRFSDGELLARVVIVDAIPGAVFHNGGRLKFGPDGFLYITTGDAQEPSLSQDTGTLAGKILRVDEDGNSVSGNPFGNPVYSYGHRNPQGIAWDSAGKLWETEHGQSATDEVNLIEPGKNYGWPIIRDDTKRDGMISPIVQSGLATWAPSGAAYLDGYLYFAGLRGEGLFRLSVEDVSDLAKVIDNLGRVRDVVVGPDNLLYIATGNTDGRGKPRTGDDKIIAVDPKGL